MQIYRPALQPATSSTSLPRQSTVNTLPISGSSAKPNQPVLDSYNRMQLGSETFTRGFNPKWYKVYPWLDFSIASREAVYFACERFLSTNDFAHSDLKLGERGLLRHTRNPSHEQAMEKWIVFGEMEHKNTNIAIELQNLHRKQ